MKMPNPEQAVVDIEKLREYCLNPQHPRGRHKARLFEAAVGLSATNAEQLRDALLEAASTREVTVAERDDYGQRYVLDFIMSGPVGRATVRSLWIVRHEEDIPRFITCYVL